jgi:hypothetical protein
MNARKPTPKNRFWPWAFTSQAWCFWRVREHDSPRPATPPRYSLKAVAAVARRHGEEVAALARDAGIELEIQESLPGLNYSNGREVIIDIVTRKAAP